jgi:hypothetical protein
MSLVFIQVVPCSLEACFVISKKTDGTVATLAQQAAHFVRDVAVIDTQGLRLPTTYLALASALLVQVGVLLWRNPVSRPEVVLTLVWILRHYACG